MAGENKMAYDSFKGTELFEFYGLLWVQDDNNKKRLKEYEKIKDGNNTTKS